MEAQRELEQRALRNVRGLVERLDVEEGVSRKRQWRLIAIAILPALVFLGFLAAKLDPTNPNAAQGKCEMDAWNAGNAEVERRLRAANPAITYGEVREGQKSERLHVLEQVKKACPGGKW